MLADEFFIEHSPAVLDLRIELEAGVEGTVDCFHELLDARCGFGGADETKVKKVQVHYPGAVKRVLDDPQRFGLISAGYGDLIGVVARLKNEEGQMFGHRGPAAVERGGDEGAVSDEARGSNVEDLLTLACAVWRTGIFGAGSGGIRRRCGRLRYG
jgi:hypothetical protein